MFSSRGVDAVDLLVSSFGVMAEFVVPLEVTLVVVGAPLFEFCSLTPFRQIGYFFDQKRFRQSLLGKITTSQS